LLAASAAHAAAGGPPELLPALDALGDGDLVRFAPHRKGRPVELEMAGRVRAPADAVIALLADPEAYRRAVPAFDRAETLQTLPGEPGVRPARRLAWELEIPLWNLEGELWLRPRADGASLELASGDLAPGRFSFTALPAPGGSVLLLRGGADLKNANWITRRLAARHAYAEPAMAVAAAYVLFRALVLEAERGAAAVARGRWPRSPLRAPDPAELSGRPLAAAFAALAPGAASAPTGAPAPAASSGPAPGSALASVHSRADGRLRSVQLALQVPLASGKLQAALAQPSPWEALPGWREIEVRPGATAGTVVWDVDASFPFVDFDARWSVVTEPRFRAAARGGDWQGAVMGWDVLPGPASGGPGCLAVLATHPRVDATGYLPRKLIEAEPLLEHGLALGLAYVNALSLLDAIVGR
jgi:hypothetical protein